MDAVQELVRSNPHLSINEMTNELGADHTTINHRLKDLGYAQKIGAWIPHQLTESHKERRATICNNLLLRWCNTEWLKHIVTGDEKWVLYFKNNAGRVLPQQLVFGAICRETRECFIVRVPDRSANTLMPII